MTNKTNHAAHCSCGEQADHVIARRKTADGIAVQLWSDGAVTCGLNTYVIRGGTTPHSINTAVRAAWLVADQASLFDHAELRKLCVSARRAVVQLSLQPINYLRAVMAGVKFQALKKGRVIQHAPACGCEPCVSRRAAIAAVPESERCYREIPLANGGSSFVRVR